MSAVTLANGKTSVHINGRLVAVGITRTGLSLREVARRCDVTFNIIYRITKDNEYSGDLPIRHLVQLARLLDLTLADLLNMDPLPNEHPDLPPPDLTGDDTDPVEADAERLAAVIALSRHLGGPDTISQGLGWDLEQLHHARRKLNEHLKPIGLKATCLNDHIYFTTTVRELRSERQLDVQRIEILETRDRTWNVTLARLMDSAVKGEHPNVHRDGDRPAIGYAVNVGYLAPGQDHDLMASQAFLDAFPDL